MKALILATLIIATACNNTSAPGSIDANTSTAKSRGTYFSFDVDGKQFDVKEENISSTYHDFTDHTEFKVFAGADGSPSLTLTIVAPMKGPSSTASGSAEPGNPISQGSVSLQNYPEKGAAWNSYDFMDANKSEPVPDAIKITTIEPDGKEASYITGIISTKTVVSANDPLSKTYRITGKFRIRHQFTSDRF